MLSRNICVFLCFGFDYLWGHSETLSFDGYTDRPAKEKIIFYKKQHRQRYSHSNITIFPYQKRISISYTNTQHDVTEFQQSNHHVSRQVSTLQLQRWRLALDSPFPNECTGMREDSRNGNDLWRNAARFPLLRTYSTVPASSTCISITYLDDYQQCTNGFPTVQLN